jgi:hypothetical protein
VILLGVHGSFLIYNLNNQYVHKVNAYIKLAINTLQVIKSKRKNDSYNELSKNNNFKDKEVTKLINHKYKEYPYMDIKCLDIKNFNIYLSDVIKELKIQKSINSTPIFAASICFFSKSIKCSKTFLLNLLNEISIKCNCSIILLIEDKSKKEKFTQINIDKGEFLTKNISYSNLLSGINTLNYYAL